MSDMYIPMYTMVVFEGCKNKQNKLNTFICMTKWDVITVSCLSLQPTRSPYSVPDNTVYMET